jgi:hypothetical protein
MWADDAGAAYNATRCVPVDPQPKEVDEPCAVEGHPMSGLDDCDEGLVCWQVEPNVGYCVPFCDGSFADPCCIDSAWVCACGASCIPPVCLPRCDPVVQDCSRPAHSCVPVGWEFVCYVAPPDPREYGQPCTLSWDCAAGLACAYRGAPPCSGDCCSPYCDLSLPNTCPDAAAGQECIPWYEPGMAPAGLEHIGYCAMA